MAHELLAFLDTILHGTGKPWDLSVAHWRRYNPGPMLKDEALLLGFVVILGFTEPKLGDVLCDHMKRRQS